MARKKEKLFKLKKGKSWVWCPYNKEIACYIQKCESCEEREKQSDKSKTPSGDSDSSKST